MTDTAAQLRRLVEIATQLNSTLNLQELLDGIIAATAELLGAESGSLLLLDEATNELVFEVASADPELVKQRMAADQGIAGAALSSKQTVVIADAANDPRFYGGVDKAVGSKTRNIVAIPLLVRDRTLGVIEAINRPTGELEGEDLDIAVALASLAAVAIDNASMYARLADAVVAARLSYRL
jgi:GAF domain-containing protein